VTCASRSLKFAFVAVCAIGFAMAAAHAQTYPQRVITIVVTSAAGGPGDTAARLIADRMSASLGQQIIIENSPGAGGTTGTARVARAEPDGYTLVLQQTGFTITPALYPKLSFDVEKDFTAIGMVNASYSFLSGRKDLPANNFAELVAWMKTPGRPAKFAHPGVGTLGHLSTVMFARLIGAEVDLIPYRGGGPAMNDIVAGHVDLVWAASSTSAELIKAKTIKGFAFQSSQRYPSIPEIPAMTELGYPDMDIKFWHALYAPAATPKPIIDRLNAALRETVADPQVMKAYADRGLEAFPPDQLSPEAANAFTQAEIQRWGKVVRDNNIQAIPQ
jgi:tripartite-type tricarboxylate transporter receptor subunit TctC